MPVVRRAGQRGRTAGQADGGGAPRPPDQLSGRGGASPMIPPPAGPRVAAHAVVDRELELAQLRARLQRLAARQASERRPPVDPFTLESVPTPHGPALRRTETVRVPDTIAAALSPDPGTIFLDTETTGLAGGTGTYVFLVGLATWSTPCSLTVTQY